MRYRLTLNKEVLSELTLDELTQVVGGAESDNTCNATNIGVCCVTNNSLVEAVTKLIHPAPASDYNF
jgi:hypothetical protein